MKLIKLAENLAVTSHCGQYRRDGVTPYYTHPERVAACLAAQGASERVVAAGWLHDVLEDTNTTAEELKACGIPVGVIEAVRILTKDKGEIYGDYLHWIIQNPIARQVKIADIIDNLSDTPTEKQIVKYAQALIYLHSAPATEPKDPTA